MKVHMNYWKMKTISLTGEAFINLVWIYTYEPLIKSFLCREWYTTGYQFRVKVPELDMETKFSNITKKLYNLEQGVLTQ